MALNTRMGALLYPPDPQRARRYLKKKQIQVHLIRQKANSPHFQAIKIIPLAHHSLQQKQRRLDRLRLYYA